MVDETLTTNAEYSRTHMGEDVKTSSAEHTREVRCVVWRLPGIELKAELRAALARPGFSVVEVTDQFAALAHAVMLTQSAAASARSLVVVVLVDPIKLEDSLALVKALTTYVPKAAVWMYEDSTVSLHSGTPQLRAIKPSDIQTWRVAMQQMADEASRELEVKVVARQEDLSSKPGSVIAPASKEVEPKRLLNDEELALLLSLDEGGGGAGGAGGVGGMGAEERGSETKHGKEKPKTTPPIREGTEPEK